MDRIEKTLEDLLADSQLSKSVDFKNGQWSFSCGGYPHHNDEFSVCFYPKDLSQPEVRYKLPSFLSEMLQGQFENGKREAQAEIRRALGI